MTIDLRRGMGETGERLAAEHLERLGLTILARNLRTRWGEIDLIATEPGRIVFCEVKTRRQGSGSPWDGLGDGKQRQVRRLAAAWLSECRDRPRAAELRFDAIGIVLDARDGLVSLDHLEAAF